MLTLYSPNASRACDGLNRRDFLRAGTLGVGGLTLASMLQAKAQSSETGLNYFRDKVVVLLFLSGGASQIETFDPKMSAPSNMRSTTGALQTTLPGETFGGTFPLLARQAHRMAVVRSFAHRIGGHQQAIIHVLTGGTDSDGREREGFGMGAMFARLHGANHSATGMPAYTLLTENEVDPQYRKEISRVQKGSRPGNLGDSFGPFNPGDGRGTAVRNMTLGIPANRFGNRVDLLRRLDAANRRMDETGVSETMNPYRRQAFNLILGGGTAQALDLSREDPRLVERYDTSHIRIGFRQFRPSTLGRQMLMARRLVEAGCGFVTVHSAGWDMHADRNNPGIVQGMNMLGRTVDKAVSAFLEDIHQRGLSDKVLFVLTGDFGRTPRVNQRGGRDHWARLGTLAFAGGGLNMGQIIGRSGRTADVPVTTPISPNHLLGTVMHTLFDIGQLRLDSGVPRELSNIIQRSEPIRELF